MAICCHNAAPLTETADTISVRLMPPRIINMSDKRGFFIDITKLKYKKMYECRYLLDASVVLSLFICSCVVFFSYSYVYKINIHLLTQYLIGRRKRAGRHQRKLFFLSNSFAKRAVWKNRCSHG